MEFQKFNKIPRLSRDCTISEKLDGSNAQLLIYNIDEELMFPFINQDPISQLFINKYSLYEKDGFHIFAGSRKRWLDCSSKGDNHGFAKWVKANAEELLKLGEGRHFGEWYGKGIQRNYGLDEKRFALFNVGKWHKSGEEKRLISIDPKTEEERYTEEAPKCCDVVPIIYEGMFDTNSIENFIQELEGCGSYAVPGFMNPEGLVIYHKASGKLFKKTIKDDEKPKGI